ncbi:hypothetical protein J6TS2_49180 [Heyndrickxia sporothermodurans]|nr:hypothetical protein J6TS2_49180 [Heyndrickxia sporothermodurans]
MSELGVNLDGFDDIFIFCLADPEKEVTYEEDRALGKISISVPYDYLSF